MTVIEFGQPHSQTILLLHGGGLSWWNYREEARLLSNQYHVVLPILDGHSKSDTPFTTIEENAARIICYIDEHLGGQVLAIGGLSLGGQILSEILSQRPDICRHALIESALVKPMPVTRSLIGPSLDMSYGLIQKKWFAKWQAHYLRIPDALFEDYYRDTCAIKKADMIAFLQANSGYMLKPGLTQTKASVTIAAGSREQKSILVSANLLHQSIPGSRMELLPGFCHGELSIHHPQQYVQLLEAGIQKEDEHHAV